MNNITSWLTDTKKLDAMFRSVLPEVADKAHGAYFLAKLNNEDDKFRDIIVDAFKQNVSIKKSDIKEKCKQKLGCDIPQNTYMKILKELAFSKTNQWIFKHGNGTS